MGKQPDNKKNDEYAMYDRRQRVAALYLAGRTQWDIARHLDVSQATVCRDLEAVREEWLQCSLRDFDAARGEQYAKLEQSRVEAVRAWERSKRPVKPGGPERCGDPRFLHEATRCITAQCRLLGLIKNDNNVTVNAVALDWDALLSNISLPYVDPVEQEIARLGYRHPQSGKANGPPALPAAEGPSAADGEVYRRPTPPDINGHHDRGQAAEGTNGHAGGSGGPGDK